MLIRILILSIFVFITPNNINAADIRIQCDDVDWIEVVKTPFNVLILADKFRGACRKDCFLLSIHLTNKGFTEFYTQLSESIGQTPDIYIGEKLVFFEILIDFIPPVEFFKDNREVNDMSTFAEYEEAEKRAFTICPGKLVKYTGVMGEKK
jgi:hypothetical protein